MPKSTRSPRSRKPKSDRPEKPYPEFPLTAHASGKWVKKILGHPHYFGTWGKIVNGQMVRIDGDGWKDALEAYKRDADDLHAGRTPRNKTGLATVADLCDAFLQAKERKRDSGEITARTWSEYKVTTDRLVEFFGAARYVDDLAPEDFEKLRADISKTWGPVRLGNEVGRIRAVFKYGFEATLLERPVRFGPEFKKPSQTALRRHTAAKGEQMFEPPEIKALLNKATPTMRAMILLGLNCAFGNHDVATLPLSAVNLKTGWIDYPRPKTGIDRRAPLWTETIEALRIAIAVRPASRQEGGDKLVFLTRLGRQWLTRGVASLVAAEFTKLRVAAGVDAAGCGFYTLRHVFRTVADGARDKVATDMIMGHGDHSIADRYRERIEDSRLVAVSDHVRAWVFPTTPETTGGESHPTAKATPARKPKRIRAAESDLPRLRVVG